MGFIHGRLTLYIGGGWMFTWEEEGKSMSIDGESECDTYPSLTVLNTLSSKGWDVVVDETPSFKHKYPMFPSISCIYLMRKQAGVGGVVN